MKPKRHPYFHVIMPLDSDVHSKEKQIAINKAAHFAKIKPHFPEYCKHAPFNLESMLLELRGSEFVLADLSFERPSCYYELGLAESLYKEVFLVAHCETPIHQTVNRDNVKFYSTSRDLEEIVEDILYNKLHHATGIGKSIVALARA